MFNTQTPAYIIDKDCITENLRILRKVREDTGCRILLAQKAFALPALYPLIGEYLNGATSSGVYEAELAYRHMRRSECHVFAPAYTPADFARLNDICDHIIFNSLAQYRTHSGSLRAGVSYGLRVNPGVSVQPDAHAMYDPCGENSRMGIRAEDLPDTLPRGIEGLHFHTLCEQGAEPLAQTLDVVFDKFGKYLSGIKWLNFGGGHHITKAEYNLPLLYGCIGRAAALGLTVYIEPGEAVALNAGYTVGTVLDVVHNGLPVAVLDLSAACHMPDVLEVPYTPPLCGIYRDGADISDVDVDAGVASRHSVIFAGNTCLAGDVIGRYDTAVLPQVGDRVVFGDMAIYSFVKNNTFNGIPLPSIYIKDGGNIDLVKQFGYSDFESRVGV
ncbi:carboxynorspermidine decarboxylase [Clostridia bacterium]|nr:carboxynorspermidine decarboxylase [Clostridia bacterium]